MGDMGEFWRDVRPDMIAASKAKRARNRHDSAQLLTAAGIEYVSKNDGAHLIVTDAHIVDFWPGTGRWIVRGGNEGRGVIGLIALIQKWRRVREQI